MKILMTTSFYPPYHIGGDAVHVKYLAEALAKKGHEVHVMFSLDAYDLKEKNKEKKYENKHKNEEDKNENIKLHPIKSPLGRLEPVLNFCVGTQRKTLNVFKRLVKQYEFDVVHHHNISLLGHNILKKQGDYKNIYTAHDFWILCHKYDLIKSNKLCESKNCFFCCLAEKRPYQIWRNWFKKYLNDIDRIIAPSNFMHSILSKELNDKKISTIPNFVKKYGNIKNVGYKDYFLYAGVLEKHKGVLNLVECFKDINENLLIAGEGSLKNKIEGFIRKENLKNVSLLGQKDSGETLSLIKNANALIMPSICFENCPLSAIEALSLGTPVIGSDKGGIPEIVEKIDSKLVFNAHNLIELRSRILNFDYRKYSSKKIREIFR